MKLYSRRKKSPIKILVIITLLVGASFALSRFFLSSKADDLIVAQIADENIFKSEIEKKINEVFSNNQSGKISFEKLPNQVLEVFAREIYLDKKIIAEAKRLGLDNTLEVKNSIESFKTSTIRQAYINNALKDSVNDQKIVEKFNELNADLESKSEYKYSQIVLRDEGGALNVLKEINNPKKPLKFADAVRKYSIDSVSSSNGGEINYKAESTINIKILETLKSIKKDEISDPIKIDELWFIVKLNDVKKSKPMEFESSKEYIRHILKIEEIEKINGKFIKDNKVKLLIKKPSEAPSENNDSPEAIDSQPNEENSSNENLENSSKNKSSSVDSSAETPESNAQINKKNNEIKQQKL
ncbi:MAG: peptidylprolyl isomerase [Proteobacteria bacterium]|nr:peptidylprolyl isomerase [Pseudomonadota bacterium]NCA28112.1 peptidylprolyl isomerase [Pseudomonadota bacterium]